MTNVFVILNIYFWLKEKILKKDSIHFDKLGIIESNQITYGSDLKISIDDIKEGYKNWLKEYMVN